MISAESFFKAVTGIAAIVASVFIPLVLDRNAEKNRQTELYIQLMTQREQSDSALRSEMFKSLIGSYFGPDILKTDPEKQMMYLHLLTLNFQEFFDARPLFEDLDRRVSAEQRARLILIARDASNRQINQLMKPDKKPTPLHFCIDATEACPRMQPFVLKGKDRAYPLSVKLMGVEDAQIRVRVSSDDDEKFNFKTTEFHVSYFDTPFMDNTKLSDGTRFSFVLRNADPKRKIATVDVIVFPDEYMNLRDRPYFDEMLSRLGGKDIAAKK